MKKFLNIYLATALFFSIMGLTILAPVNAEGALFDAQNQASNEMVVQIDGTVSDKIQQDNVYFISGDFSEAQLNNGPLVERNNMIILNLKDKRFAYWQIDTDGPVFDLEIGKNLLFIGGSFEMVDGVLQKNSAIFDINTKKILTDYTGTNFPVNSFAQFENTVFVGGSFTQMVDTDKQFLASYDTEKRVITSWNPQLNGIVNDMAIYKNRLYVVGEFTKANDVERKYAASFLLPEGELTNWIVAADGPIKEIDVAENAIVLLSDVSEPISAEFDTSSVDKTAISSIVLSQEEIVREGLSINIDEFGFKIPTLGDLLTFAIRAFFVIAGLAGLFYLLLGALAWVTSGGDKDSVKAAREKIQAAVIGMILIVAVLGIVWTLEQVIFNRRICLGLSCPLTLPSLIEPN
ncbi:hypothetical protein COY16_05645 [Candidatus Roizmanbacteria bacterium CG_4_10_14_0_2_um_filter_39_13]|uniref:Rax2-like C-terminal domain-containing protein n=1 Tax=Candidatus Roizmanbacteria bacterium CG_4_10_14_0_2_um_filter_39_13 TaxID=1974825 RepID=A0A2M7TVS6_9BACT|nr:MAG: hypothetical protein COY16_05645 [Candidatus Roizmanbacteria bacterium CG_4_10_14_0_2_um_filter_39_13]